MTKETQTELTDDPVSDGVSSLAFSPEVASHLLVSSWDKNVRLYDVISNQLLAKYQHKAAVLDTAFVSSNMVLSGGLDKELKCVELETLKESVWGKHGEAIKCVEYAKEAGVAITGSWDRCVKFWDPRSGQGASSEIASYQQPEKIFALDVVQEKLVVAMAGRVVMIYDVRNMKEPTQQRESSKFMTRTLRCMPNGDGYASGSIEGRVAVEFFDPSPESQARKYAFKCHREKLEGIDTVYPVNSLAFHPIHGTFASGGGDGFVYLWDGYNKKRLKQFPRYLTGISSLAFSCDGQHLAIASSYTYEEGEKDHPPDTVYVRTLLPSETRPKTVAE